MEEPVRERGTQSRRAKGADGGPIDDPTDAQVPSATPRPPTRTPRVTSSGRASGGAGYWPAVAIIAIVVATAGWTTVAVMALNGSGGSTAVVPSASDDPNATIDDTEADFSEEPIAESHEAPDLEALLPTEVGGTPLTLQSWTGDTLLSDGGTWSEALTTYLTSIGKSPADLTAAQALDPSETIDHSVGVFRVPGVPTSDLRDALVNAWKNDYPELAISTVTLDGIEVTKGDFGEDAIDSYWYEKDGLLFDVETSDEAIATTILAGIRDGSFPTSSGAPSGSAAPSSPVASPSPS
jgi:hypothetical protein